MPSYEQLGELLEPAGAVLLTVECAPSAAGC